MNKYKKEINKKKVKIKLFQSLEMHNIKEYFNKNSQN